jgi:PhzF family phenazine biosynthesis protein
MQSVAAEMNLSETAFIVPLKSGFRLRWFTPTVEVDLCGHATMAAAHVLWSEKIAPASAVLRFHTKSGILAAQRLEDRIELDFPVRTAKKTRALSGLEKALGVKAKNVVKVVDDLLVEVASENVVRKLKPDLDLLSKIKVRGVIVTAQAKAKYDFVSRFFGPAVGVPEDPVTGSAHCALAPYWAERLGLAVMRGYQASERGGEVDVEVVGERVMLRGQAVTVLRGQLVL